MKICTSSVAVLLFALPSSQEAQRKPLAGAGRQGQRIWQALEQLTLSKINAAGLPALVSHQLPGNPSGTFGEQLQRAVQAVFKQGYHSVICVGNDCPSLRPHDLTQAAQALAQGQIPVGANRRGGVYLVGFTRNSLTNNSLLALLPWQTTGLTSALLAHLHGQGQTPMLLAANRADWNTRAVVCPHQVAGNRQQVVALLAAFWGRQAHVGELAPVFFLPNRPAPCGLRGPPALG